MPFTKFPDIRQRDKYLRGLSRAVQQSVGNDLSAMPQAQKASKPRGRTLAWVAMGLATGLALAQSGLTGAAILTIIVLAGLWWGLR